jgi:hypothetical protein
MEGSLYETMRARKLREAAAADALKLGREMPPSRLHRIFFI